MDQSETSAGQTASGGNLEKSEISQAIGFYLHPRVWVCEPPPYDDALQGSQLFDITRIWDCVVKEDLRCGIKVKVYRFGLFAFKFNETLIALEDRSVPDFQLLTAHALTRQEKLNAFILIMCSEIAKIDNYSFDKSNLRSSD